MRWLFLLCFSATTLFGAPFKIIVFDYGGVIAKVDRQPVIDFLAESLEVPQEKLHKDFAKEKLYLAFNEPREYWEKYSKKALARDWIEDLERHKRLIVQPMPGMQELIAAIKEQNIQVALLSNTNKHRAQFLESMGGYSPFDPVLLSCYLGCSKPHPKIYSLLLKALRAKPQECFFIDNKAQNVAEAKRHGIEGVTFESVEQLKESLQEKEVFLSSDSKH